jgi:hypothetical protein
VRGFFAGKPKIARAPVGVCVDQLPVQWREYSEFSTNGDVARPEFQTSPKKSICAA